MSEVKYFDTAFVVRVAGVSFYQGVVRALREGQRVVARRDPFNEWDPNAIALFTVEGDIFGHIPREVSAHRLIKGLPEGPWGGVVTEVLTGGDNWGVRVKLICSGIEGLVAPPKESTAYHRKERKDEKTADEGAVLQQVEPFEVSTIRGRYLGITYNTAENPIEVFDEHGERRLYPAGNVLILESDTQG